MSEAILRTCGLDVGYGSRVVIGGVELSLVPGRITTLIGPNGAGKSTILKTLIRQLRPIAGSVLLDGRDIAGLREQEMAKSVAAVLTGRPRPELMTCADVVSTGRYPYTGRLGILSERDRQIARESMELVHVTELADLDFNRISDGQRQRVLLARAICQEPRVLVMDEPTSFLDIRHKLDFLCLRRRLVREKELAVVLSLHELDLAQRFSDTVLCVRAGRMDRIGTPEEVFQGDYITRLYGVTHGSYNTLLGGVESERPAGEPEIFVVGGGGSGIPVYRLLQRLGIPFAAGVLPASDADFAVACTLAAETVTVPPFEPVSRESEERALALAQRCRGLICTAERFGPENQENRALVEQAKRRGALMTPEQVE